MVENFVTIDIKYLCGKFLDGDLAMLQFDVRQYALKYHFVLMCRYRKKLFKYKRIVDEMKRLFVSIGKDNGFLVEVTRIDIDCIYFTVNAAPDISPNEIIVRLKGLSTYLIWKKFPTLLDIHFWQEKPFWGDGYYVCTVGEIGTDAIYNYIERQGLIGSV